jgi:hypothetical protein
LSEAESLNEVVVLLVKLKKKQSCIRYFAQNLGTKANGLFMYNQYQMEKYEK